MRLARQQPLVVVLEDLHWADEMSVRLLAFLGRRLRGVPAAGAGHGPRGGARGQPAPPPDPGRARRERPGWCGVPLAPALPRGHRRPRSGARAPGHRPIPLLANLAEEAWRASDGNAFVVVEVMHALREGAPVPGARRLSLPAESGARPPASRPALQPGPATGRRRGGDRTPVRLSARPAGGGAIGA